MYKPQSQSFLLTSPALIFFIVALSIFIAEASVMLLFYFLPEQSLVSGAIIDALLLVVLVSPALYYFLFRPIVIHIRNREQIEEVLRKNEEEQFKIMIRTSLDAFVITDRQGASWKLTMPIAN